jgi:hypothetical protein
VEGAIKERMQGDCDLKVLVVGGTFQILTRNMEEEVVEVPRG